MPRILAAILLALAGCFPLPAGAAESLTVFAAASLKDAMDRAAPAFEAQSGVKVTVSLAASSVLARQIAAGAPADVYVSANPAWMDWVAEHGAIRDDSVRIVTGNALVIVSAGDGAATTKDPATLITRGRLAMGDPSHVPAGQYAMAALESLGLWEEARRHAVYAENVRVALELARRGEVPAAIVYASDEKAVAGLSRAYTFPADSHPPIRYPAAATAEAGPRARAFIDFLAGPEGQAIFRDLGFTTP